MGFVYAPHCMILGGEGGGGGGAIRRKEGEEEKEEEVVAGLTRLGSARRVGRRPVLEARARQSLLPAGHSPEDKRAACARFRWTLPARFFCAVRRFCCLAAIFPSVCFSFVLAF